LGRCIEKVISISAVQMPTPRSEESSLQTSSSLLFQSASIFRLPSITASAADLIYAAFRIEIPCFCKEAVKYRSVITFTFENVTANAKSVLSVLGACVKQGDEIEIVCQGPDEEEALDALCKAVESGLED